MHSKPGNEGALSPPQKHYVVNKTAPGVANSSGLLSAHSLGLQNEKGVTRCSEASPGIQLSCSWFRASFPTEKGLQRPTVLAQFISSNFLESLGYSSLAFRL